MRLYRRDAEALGNPLRSSQRCEVGSDGQATRLEQIRLLRDRRVHNPRTLSVARPFLPMPSDPVRSGWHGTGILSPDSYFLGLLQPPRAINHQRCPTRRGPLSRASLR